jgi:hypothetical protein
MIEVGQSRTPMTPRSKYARVWSRRPATGQFESGSNDTMNLPNSWMIGKTRVTHEGFGVYKLRGHLNSPSDLVSGPHGSAQKAVETAENFGEGHAAFRIVTTPRGRGSSKLAIFI